MLFTLLTLSTCIQGLLARALRFSSFFFMNHLVRIHILLGTIPKIIRFDRAGLKQSTPHALKKRKEFRFVAVSNTKKNPGKRTCKTHEELNMLYGETILLLSKRS